MSVSCGELPEGISVSPMKAELQKNGTVTLTVTALEGASGTTLQFGVQPTGETISIPLKIQ
jgi:hypothetical protein